ncbi:uncharacterized protein LOC131659670 [Vicia villosa]|uniref:uncharacterized protein LOC131659670 n=1 Tax=Vicia villosa TaxID=3911 RepID=UPI00273C3CA7|nr:uncharacterized protein LOC131659670 [Vicia villosa]
MARGRGRPKNKAASPAVPPTVNGDQGGAIPKASETILSQDCDSATVDGEFETLDGKSDLEIKTKGDALSEQKLWVDVISGNRLPDNGITIAYSAPKIVEGEIEVEIEAEDVQSKVKFWEHTLIMYVLGKELSMNDVKQFMLRTWNFIQLPELFYHDDGYFLMKFKNNKEKKMVLLRGPYSIHNMPTILKNWCLEFNFQRDMIRTIPVWIKLPNLPLQMWGASSFGKIGSVVGKPLFTDECTDNKSRISYARILVEIDITKKQKESVTIKDCEGKKFNQPIEFEWKPKYCDTCQKVGHQCEKEKPKAVKKWQPVKAKEDTPVAEVSTPNIPIENNTEQWTEVANTRKLKVRVVFPDAE